MDEAIRSEGLYDNYYDPVYDYERNGYERNGYYRNGYYEYNQYGQREWVEHPTEPVDYKETKQDWLNGF